MFICKISQFYQAKTQQNLVSVTVIFSALQQYIKYSNRAHRQNRMTDITGSAVPLSVNNETPLLLQNDYRV